MNADQDRSECGGRCLLEVIRARAFQIFEARGCIPGHDLADWLEAEGEIKNQLGFKSPCTKKQKRSS